MFNKGTATAIAVVDTRQPSVRIFFLFVFAKDAQALWKM